MVEVQGYVYFIRAFATSDNEEYAGDVYIYYGGKNKRFIDSPGFGPYKTEESAKRAEKSWKEFLKRLSDLEQNWRYQLGGIMSITEAMIEESQKQHEAIAQKANKLMSEAFKDLIPNMEKMELKRKFRIVK